MVMTEEVAGISRRWFAGRGMPSCRLRFQLTASGFAFGYAVTSRLRLRRHKSPAMGARRSQGRAIQDGGCGGYCTADDPAVWCYSHTRGVTRQVR